MATSAGHRFDVATPAGPVTVTVADAAEACRLRPRIEAWLAGSRDAFEDVPTPAGTAFQRACWDACRAIPHGEVRTYAWLAAAAGRPRAARAAGQAMRRNPLPVVIPCHRVVGSAGWVGGYAGDADAGGATVAVKRALLAVERPVGAVPCSAPHVGAAPCRGNSEIHPT